MQTYRPTHRPAPSLRPRRREQQCRDAGLEELQRIQAGPHVVARGFRQGPEGGAFEGEGLGSTDGLELLVGKMGALVGVCVDRAAILRTCMRLWAGVRVRGGRVVRFMHSFTTCILRA